MGYPGTASSPTLSLALVSQVLLGKVRASPPHRSTLDAASAAQPGHATGAEQRLYAFLTWPRPPTVQGSPPTVLLRDDTQAPQGPQTCQARGLGSEPRSSDLELPL